jgi:hypothetical protein
MHSAGYDKEELREFSKRMLDGDMTTKPFKRIDIDADVFNEAYSFEEKPLSNAEIKEFVEINVLIILM